MIIKKLYIGAFGKIKDFTLELSTDINIIYGENEAGKSTIQAMLKAILYGMNSQKKDIKGNPRKRYMPWSGEQASGKLYIEDEKGRSYIISRSFGKVRREDQCSVQNSISGEKAVHIDQDTPGKSILGIGEDAFEKTLMIGALGAEVIRGKDDEIMHRLTNLQQSGDSGVSYHKAMKKLDEVKKSLTNIRKNGKLDEAREAIYSLQEERREIIKLHEENIDLLLAINELNEKKDKLIKNIELLEREKLDNRSNVDLIDSDQYTEDIRERCNDLENKRNEVKRLQFEINEKLRETSECDELIAQFEAFATLDDHVESKVISLEEERKSIHLKLTDLKNYKEEVISLRLQLQEETRLQNSIESGMYHNKSKNSFFDLFTTILSLILASIGVVAAIIENPSFYILTLIGILIIIYNVVSSRISFSVSKNSRQSASEGYKGSLIRNIEMANNISIIRTKIEEKEKLIKNYNETELHLQLEKNLKFLNFIFKHCNVESVTEFIEKLNIYKDLKNDVSNIHKQLYNLKNKHLNLQSQIFSLEKEILDYLIGKYDNNIKCNVNELVNVEKEIKEYESSLQFIFKDKPQLSQVEEEIASIEEKIKDYECKLSAINIAQEVLEDAFSEIQSSFGPKVNNITADILSKITSNKYSDVLVGEDYSVKLVTPKDQLIKDIDYFSSGTSDQIYLALRLAIAQILFEDKSRYFIILDDPFTQYDDIRLQNVLEFLAQYSSKVQIIIFTCQSREHEYLRDRCNYIKL